MGQTKVNHKMGHRLSKMPVTFLWHKSGSTLGFSTLQRAKQMPAVEEFTRNWSQWHCNSPNACLGIFCSSAHKFPHWSHFQGSQQEILKYAEDPRKAEGTEFSKQTTVGGLFFYNGGGSREKSCTCVKPTLLLHWGNLDTPNSMQMNCSQEKKKEIKNKVFPGFGNNSWRDLP